MNKLFGAALLGAAAGTTACFYGAKKLFNSVIPRESGRKVDVSEMADAGQWEMYKKFMVSNREWIEAQGMEHITITSYDGLTLHADYLKAEGESNKLVICHHGYTTNGLANCSSPARFFHDIGYDCIILDLRAHGKSEGDYVGFGILDRFDTKKWIEYVDERFENKKDIVLYGTSMGGTTSLMTLGFPDLSLSVKAVIADCAFTSPYEIFAHVLRRDYHLPPFPVMNINDSMCRKKAGYGFKDYSTTEAVSCTEVPVLFTHGRKDSFVPVYMTEKNYEACNSAKEIFWVDNASHAAAYYEDTEGYQERIKAFLEKYV